MNDPETENTDSLSWDPNQKQLSQSTRELL